MKKVILSTILFCSFSLIIKAQEIRINTYAAYVFADKFDSYYDPYNYYQGRIEDGLQWGAGLEYKPTISTGVELLYLHQDTHAPTTYATGNNYFAQYADFKMGINYIMLAGSRGAKSPNGKVEGTGGLMLGCVWANLENPENGRESTATKFAWGIKAGANIWATPKIGIKLQAQLLSAVQSMGGGFYFGTGGSSAGLSTYSTIYQFSLGGGLVFNLSK